MDDPQNFETMNVSEDLSFLEMNSNIDKVPDTQLMSMEVINETKDNFETDLDELLKEKLDELENKVEEHAQMIVTEIPPEIPLNVNNDEVVEVEVKLEEDMENNKFIANINICNTTDVTSTVHQVQPETKSTNDSQYEVITVKLEPIATNNSQYDVMTVKLEPMATNDTQTEVMTVKVEPMVTNDSQSEVVPVKLESTATKDSKCELMTVKQEPKPSNVSKYDMISEFLKFKTPNIMPLSLRKKSKNNINNIRKLSLANKMEKKRVMFDFIHISDKIVPPRAFAVLPTTLQHKKDIISASRLLPPRLRFGPVKGVKRLITKSELRSIVSECAAMKLPAFFLESTNGEVTYIDTSDKDKSNWIGLLPIGNYETANIWLYEECNELYGFTIKYIPPMKPLMLGYNKAYADKYNLPTFQPILDLTAYADTTKKWLCEECDRYFVSANQMQRHLDFYHKNEKPLPWMRYSCRRCLNTFPRFYTLKSHEEMCEKAHSKPEHVFTLKEEDIQDKKRVIESNVNDDKVETTINNEYIMTKMQDINVNQINKRDQLLAVKRQLIENQPASEVKVKDQEHTTENQLINKTQKVSDLQHESEKQRITKKQQFADMQLESEKQLMTQKQQCIDFECVSKKRLMTQKRQFTDMQLVSEKQLMTEKPQFIDTEHLSKKQLIAEKQQLTEMKLVSEKQLITGNQQFIDINHVSKKQLIAEKQQFTDMQLVNEKQLMTGKQQFIDIEHLSKKQLIAEKQQLTDMQLVSEKQLMTGKQQFIDIEHLSKKQLIAEKQKLTDMQLVSEKQLMTVKQPFIDIEHLSKNQLIAEKQQFTDVQLVSEKWHPTDKQQVTNKRKVATKRQITEKRQLMEDLLELQQQELIKEQEIINELEELEKQQVTKQQILQHANEEQTNNEEQKVGQVLKMNNDQNSNEELFVNKKQILVYEQNMYKNQNLKKVFPNNETGIEEKIPADEYTQAVIRGLDMPTGLFGIDKISDSEVLCYSRPMSRQSRPESCQSRPQSRQSRPQSRQSRPASRQSRPDSVFGHYQLADKDDDSLLNDDEFIKFSDYLMNSDIEDPDKHLPKIGNSCIHWKQSILMRKRRKHLFDYYRRCVAYRYQNIFLNKKRFIQYIYREYRKDYIYSKMVSSKAELLNKLYHTLEK